MNQSTPKPTQGQPKAYSYIRFSSKKQADGDSLARQIEKAEEWHSHWPRRHEIPLDISTYRDLGVSGWKGKNSVEGALSAFIAAARAGRIARGSYLIIENLDRLTRQAWRVALELFLDVQRLGIHIVTLTPEVEHNPNDPQPYRLIEAIFSFIANNEKSEVLSDRLRKTWNKKAIKAREENTPLTKWCPAWLELVDGKYRLIPDKAKIVKKMVQWSLDGWGDIRLCRRLNAENVPLISCRKAKHKRVQTWTNSYISKILRSPALIGNYEPGHEVDGRYVKTGEVWQGYFPAVITENEWKKLRAIRQKSTRRAGRVGDQVANIFTGLLFSARDGLPLHRLVKDVPRLISSGHRNGNLKPDRSTISYDAFERGFLAAFSEQMKLNDLFAPENIEPDNTLNNLEADLADVTTRIDEARRRAATVANFSELLNIVSDLETHKAKLQQQIAQEQNHQAVTGKSEVKAAFQNLVALGKLYKFPEGNDHRTRLRGRVNQLVESAYVLIYGKLKSKFKAVEVQIRWKAGGCSKLLLTVERTTLLSYQISTCPEGAVDFRLYNEPAKGKRVRQYDEQNNRLFVEEQSIMAHSLVIDGENDSVALVKWPVPA